MVRGSQDSYTVILYNPAARRASQTVSLPLFSATAVTVTDSLGNTVVNDVVPVARTAAHTADSATLAVVFNAEVAGLGYETFVIAPTSVSRAAQRLRKLSGPPAAPAPAFLKPSADSVVIENGLLSLSFDNASGLLSSWTDKSTGETRAISQQFLYYQASSNGSYGTSSPYTFQPAQNTGLFPASNSSVGLSVFRGQTVQLVVQRWSDWLTQTVRLYAAASLPSVEVEWTVGPVQIDDGVSREVVTKYSTDIASQGRFVTDSNGREFQLRIRNQRLSFNWTVVEPVAGNYYPVPVAIGLNDSSAALYVLVDRAEGGSSLQDGAVELMLHRRLLYECGFDENMNETDGAYYTGQDGTGIVRTGQGLIITGRHQLLLSRPAAALENARLLQQRLYTPLHPVFAATPASPAQRFTGTGAMSFMRAEASLPANVELMTLQLLFDGRVLLRLAHSFAVGESEQWSAPAQVDLDSLFVQPIQSVQQLTLTANADYQSMVKQRLSSMTMTAQDRARYEAMHAGLQGTTITIYPMQILSFALAF